MELGIDGPLKPPRTQSSEGFQMAEVRNFRSKDKRDERETTVYSNCNKLRVHLRSGLTVAVITRVCIVNKPSSLVAHGLRWGHFFTNFS